MRKIQTMIENKYKELTPEMLERALIDMSDNKSMPEFNLDDFGYIGDGLYRMGKAIAGKKGWNQFNDELKDLFGLKGGSLITESEESLHEEANPENPIYDMDMSDNSDDECGLHSTLGVECIRKERVAMGPFVAYDKLNENESKTIVYMNKLAEPIRQQLSKVTMLDDTINFERYIKALSIFGAILATEIEKASISMDKLKSDKSEGDKNNKR